jgi:hypothetical protein
MRHICSATVLVLSLLSMNAVAQAHDEVNIDKRFEGSWVLKKALTQIFQLDLLYEGYEFEVKLEGQELQVERSFILGNRRCVQRSTYFLDGRGEENILTYPHNSIFVENSITKGKDRKISIKYTLRTDASAIPACDPGIERRNVEWKDWGTYTLSLSKDGETLKIAQRPIDPKDDFPSYLNVNLTFRRK